MHDKHVVCDCHCVPMYHLAVSLLSANSFVKCWASDCGRYYFKSHGYFYLRPTQERIDKHTRSMTPCPNKNCTTPSFMAIVNCCGATGYEGKTCWYCFECGAELPLEHAIPQLLGLQ